MGFYVTCALTQNIISEQDDVIMLTLTKAKHTKSYGIEPWTYWKPIPIFFEGQYDGYGGLNNGRLFQSVSFLSEYQLEQCEQFLLSQMSLVMCGENGENLNTESVSHFLNSRYLYVKTEAPNIEYFKDMLKQMNRQHEILFSGDKEFLQLNQLETPEKLSSYIKEHDKPVLNEVTKMFFNKNALIAFLYEYGMNQREHYEYARNIQSFRHRDLLTITPHDDLQMFFDYANTYGKWGGGNSPLYDYNKAFKAPEFELFNEKKSMQVLSQIQSLDLMLINHYFGLMGQQFEPTSSVTESAFECGYQSSYNLRQRLRTIK